MAHEVSALMGAIDEEEWEREGLFTTVDELCKLKAGGCSLNDPSLPSCKDFTPLSFPLFTKGPSVERIWMQSGYVTEPSAPGLSKEWFQRFGGEGLDTGDTKPGTGTQRVHTWASNDHFLASSQRGNLSVKDSLHKKSVRAWKPKKVCRRLVIGMDVGLEETCQLSLCALVGRFAYKTRSNLSFSEWMQVTWLPLIGYVPEYLTLPCGWFGLVFKSPEDVELILNRFWDFEGGSIMLKRWRTRFDPAT
jgi:hypothetical protein